MRSSTTNQLLLEGFQFDPIPLKTLFLYSLRSKTGNWKYIGYKGSPLRYQGGKSRAVATIIEHFPDPLPDKMVSPFLGGGTIEIASANELGIQVIGYDIFEILTNYWQIQLTRADQLANKLALWDPTKEQYQLIKETLTDHWENINKIEDPLELAAHYWFNHNLSYGPNFLGWMSKIYLCIDRYYRFLDKIRNFRCPLLSVEQGPFEQTITSHPFNFLYCDPPYYLDEGQVFTGMYPRREDPIYHKGFNHELLRDLLHSHQDRFILSYNDCPTIRDWYSEFNIIEVSWQYSLGQGETRIGKYRTENKAQHIKKSHELLIIKS